MTKETSFVKVKINTDYKKLFKHISALLENKKYRHILNNHINDLDREYIIDKLLQCIPVNNKHTGHPADIVRKYTEYVENKIKRRVTRWFKKRGYQVEKIKGYDQIFTALSRLDTMHVSKQAKIITVYEIVNRLIKGVSIYEKQIISGYISYCFSIIPDYIKSNYTQGEIKYYVTTVKNAQRSKYGAVLSIKDINAMFGRKRA